ncbi:hypothetical protein Tco_0312843 [Tanacetum coccineum]
MESSNSNSKEGELQLTQRLAKQRHSHCMAWFEQLETHLHDLYLNSSSHVVDAFKQAFHSLFGEELQTFRLKMFHNLDQLRLQLEKENLLEVNPRTYFKEFTSCEPDTYRHDLLENMDTLEAVIHRAAITYGKLQLQSQDVQINPVQAVDDSLVTESPTLEANLSMDVNALEVGLAVTENIRPVKDKEPMAEVQLTVAHNVLANEQQHTDQSKPVIETYLLDKVVSNTLLIFSNICHRGGETDQDAEQYQAKSPLLKSEFLKTNDMVEKEVFNELSNRFLQLEKHCISLEISMQQMEESFQLLPNHVKLGCS